VADVAHTFDLNGSEQRCF